jgi:hypothetical protein
VYIFVFRSRECALISGAEEERLTHHTYHIHQSGRRDLDWIDPVKKKSFFGVFGREKIEERKCKRKQNAHIIISEKEKNGVPNLDRV